MRSSLLGALCVRAVLAQGPAPEPEFPRVAGALLAGEHRRGFLSATLGDHMVLQRAPQAAVVWGFTAPGAKVTTDFDGHSYAATADAAGVWRQELPPTEASMTPHQLAFNSSSGENASLQDVLFGDVYICGGQSNMQFSMSGNVNATAEMELADGFPNIRLFTVGQKTSSDSPLDDLQTIVQRWEPASHHALAAGGPWDYFSAVCWFFGRELSQKHSNKLPLGLISNNWGGTPVEYWSTAVVFRSCNKSASGNGKLWNAMVRPYTLGPMALTGFTWYQGEANAGHAAEYACLFPAMISEWRRAFENPTAYFGFVQLSTWCDKPSDLAEIRLAQMAAARLPMVGYATNADHGAGCNIHPPAKQFCGVRLAASALALHYGRWVAWRSPSFESVEGIAAKGGSVSVSVRVAGLSTAGLTTDVRPFNYVPGLNCKVLEAKQPGTCAWGSIGIEGGRWLNATVSAVEGGRSLLLRAQLPGGLSTAQVTGTAYGYGAIPLMNAYDKLTGLPVLPWRELLSPAPTLATFV